MLISDLVAVLEPPRLDRMDLDSHYHTECSSIVLGNKLILILGNESGRTMICAAGTERGYSGVLALRAELHPYECVPMTALSDDLELI
jgi:hypothetical protein